MREYNINRKVVIVEPTKENNYDGYFEVPYIEYREDGTIYGTGTEDFSSKRLNTLTTYKVLEKTREKTKSSSVHSGGRNRWRQIALITVAKRIDVTKIASKKYEGKELQIRSFY